MTGFVVDVLVICLLALLVIFQAGEFRKQREEWKEERNMLLDRIMARSYEVYVNAEALKEQVRHPAPPEEYEERGVPVV